MTIHVINLDRDTERLTTFLKTNAHVPDIVRVPAVDGRTIDRKALLDLGIMSNDLDYTDSQVGCALSHIRLWRKSLRYDGIVTIAEDDAVFARNFHLRQDLILRDLPADWGVMLWGWNFDAHMSAELIDGVAAAVIRPDQNALRQNIDLFSQIDINASAFRLHCAFGVLGYSVSPLGAKILLDTCVPLSASYIQVDDKGTSIRNVSIDCIANAAYRLMKSYICIPPLAVSENVRRSSIR